MAGFRDPTRAAFIRQPLGDEEYIHVFGDVDLGVGR